MNTNESTELYKLVLNHLLNACICVKICVDSVFKTPMFHKDKEARILL